MKTVIHNANHIIGNNYNIVLVTLDTLRYDVAQQLFLEGKLPHFSKYLPETGWEKRHTAGSFTFAAHQAFFAGFLPTPADNPKQPRLFATHFLGSETTSENTCVFQEADIVSGLRGNGYHTICIGGVGFFNKQTALGSVLPSFFDESHWDVSLGVTNPHSTENQINKAKDCIRQLADKQKFFLFINISAIHQPNCGYLLGAEQDNLETHAAALQYVDSQIPLLMDFLKQRGNTFCIFCADHGTAYGEDGYFGHRLAHTSVWEVPYAEFIIK